MPMLMLCREKVAVVGGHVRERGSSLTSSLSASTPRMTHAGSAVIHTPERSRRPFASRGVAAARSTPPFAVRGARGLGYLNHCALTDADAPATRIIRIVASRLLMKAILARGAGLSSIAFCDAAHRSRQYDTRVHRERGIATKLCRNELEKGCLQCTEQSLVCQRRFSPPSRSRSASAVREPRPNVNSSFGPRMPS